MYQLLCVSSFILAGFNIKYLSAKIIERRDQEVGRYVFSLPPSYITGGRDRRHILGPRFFPFLHDDEERTAGPRSHFLILMASYIYVDTLARHKRRIRK